MGFQKSVFIKNMHSSWSDWFSRNNGFQILNSYIPPDCSDSQNYSESSRHSLDKTIEIFLSDADQKLLLILGDARSGKTSLALKLEWDYWENKKRPKIFKHYLPICIDLKSYNKSNIKDCISDTLRKKYQLPDATISYLKQQSKDIQLLVIFDGYDEIDAMSKLNIFAESQLNQWNCRVKSIVTCRTQHFSSNAEFKKYFSDCSNININQSEILKIHYSLESSAIYPKQIDGLKIINIAPFSENQINQYLAQYDSNYKKNSGSNNFPLKAIQSLLSTQSDFKELMINPYLLQIFSDAALELLNSNQISKERGDLKINLTELCRMLLKDWFKTAKEKLEQRVENFKIRNEAEKEIDIEECFFQYARQLAYAYFEHGIHELKYEINSIEDSEFKDPGSITEGYSAFQEFFSNESQELIEARRACPLKRSGDKIYSFVHKSFQDYLTAEYLYLALKHEEMKEKIVNIWKAQYLSENREVLRFLSELIAIDENKNELEEKLLELVKHSRIPVINEAKRDIEKASSNAISVLNWNQYSFAGMDLEGIRIPKAYLDKVIFYGTNLKRSKLRGCSAKNSDWREANLAESDLRELEFGECPHWEQVGRISCFVFNKQGTQIATGDDKGVLKLCNFPDFKLIREYRGHEGRINSVAFNPDGLSLASAGCDKTIRIWHIEADTEKQILIGHNDEVTSISFSVDGVRLASGSYDRTIRIWDLERGVEEKKLMGHANEVTSISFNIDGSHLASGSEDKTIVIWDFNSGKIKRRLKQHTAGVISVAFSMDGLWLASGSWDKTIRIWNLLNWQEEWKLKGHEHWVSSVSFSLDGLRVASGSADNTVRIWNLKNGLEEHKHENHTSVVTAVNFSVDGLFVVSSSYDNTIRILSVHGGQEKQELICLQADNANLENAKIDDMNRKLLEQRGAKNSKDTALVPIEATANSRFFLSSSTSSSSSASDVMVGDDQGVNTYEVNLGF